jgi:hypothetical protein
VENEEKSVQKTHSKDGDSREDEKCAFQSKMPLNWKRCHDFREKMLCCDDDRKREQS